jgi:cytochrome P450 / NADPH-cytochrome P450 reductase
LFGYTVINERRANPIDKKDVLNTMLYSQDPKTGQRMSDDSIVQNVRRDEFRMAFSNLPTHFQLITFLVAGHETSSGMMSFMTYFLIKYVKRYSWDAR